MPDRFIITTIEETTIPSLIFLVEDTLTGRVREASHEIDDASAVALWLNSGHHYVGGEPLAPALLEVT